MRVQGEDCIPEIDVLEGVAVISTFIAHRRPSYGNLTTVLPGRQIKVFKKILINSIFNRSFQLKRQSLKWIRFYVTII